jgi:hypothetical protein
VRGARRLLPSLLGSGGDDGGGDGHGGGRRGDGLRGDAAGEQRLEAARERSEVEAVAQPREERRPLLRALEPLGQRPPRAEDQRLDRRLGEPHLLRDLAVRESLPLPQEDRLALRRRHPDERLLELDELVRAHPRRRGDVLLQRLDVAGRLDAAAAERGATAREADVLGDLEQPRRLGLRDDPALQAAEGVQERLLDGVLGLLAAAEFVEAVAEELRRVALVQVLRRRRLGGDLRLDSGGATDVRDCGQVPPSCALAAKRTSASRPILGEIRRIRIPRTSVIRAGAEFSPSRARGAGGRTAPRARAAGSG